ncbi:hypothetical protein [Cyclobacterium jeungdonense]|uniref:ASCH domain-containing protein n=1 Tax=Cyclobacterium jeungdonense TaxID=708087 RepID=A0ABT8C2J9_9BACT|nr:hypothetical protein [Cyclobacterium jeungdonense]MDN3687004.1 hypothetical protein [Cyclobacterium jeungdonense]
MKSEKPAYFCLRPEIEKAYGYSHAEYRHSIYTHQFPTGSWLEVKGLALPEFLIEIELEVHKPQ